MQSLSSYHSDACSDVLWLSAVPAEIWPVLAFLEQVTSVPIAGQDGWRGCLGGQWLSLAVSGVGGEQCQRVLTAILDGQPHARVLLVGAAGGLNPALQLGDVVVASRAVSWPPRQWSSAPTQVLGAAGTAPHLDRNSGEEGTAGFRVISGCVLSWDEIVRDERLRAMLHNDYGADCVDMETGFAAQVCHARGVPFLAIRGISDRADATIRIGESATADWAAAVWRATVVAVQALSAT